MKRRTSSDLGSGIKRNVPSLFIEGYARFIETLFLLRNQTNPVTSNIDQVPFYGRSGVDCLWPSHSTLSTQLTPRTTNYVLGFSK